MQRLSKWTLLLASGGTVFQLVGCLDDLVQPVLLDIAIATLLAGWLGQPVI